MNIDQFQYCLIDADSIIYSIAHTEPSPALCKKKFDEAIKRIIETTDALQSMVFIKGDGNFRITGYPTYKSNRKDTIDPAVKDRIKMLYEHAKEYCIESDNGEADDYMAISANTCSTNDLSHVVAHIDKDLNCIPGWHHNFRTGVNTHLHPSESYLFMMRQFLMGDATDGIKGITKLGPVTAAKILNENNTDLDGYLKIVLSTWEQRVGKGWQEQMSACMNQIMLRQSHDDLRVLSYEELIERITWQNWKMGMDSETKYMNKVEDGNAED